VVPRLGAPALVAAACAGLLVGAAAWWQAVDSQVPDFDSGKHLLITWSYADYLRAGDPTEIFSGFTRYPPLMHLVGALGTLIAGVNVAPPILAVALVFAPLLVASLYRAGVLIGDRWTGALAAVFVVGAPMIVTEFRAYMLEVPMTALLALAAWLLLVSRRFERVGVSALAGIATGLGMLSKQTFAFMIAGLIAMLVLRGGWRHPRGLLSFAAVTLALAAPWYSVHWEELQTTSDWARGPNAAGAIWSTENLTWYVWDTVNRQLLLPLSAFAAVGALVSLIHFIRRRDVDDYTPELLAGVLVAWGALTFYLHLKAPYYSLPLTVYGALLATGWIARRSGSGRIIAGGALSAIALVNFVVAATWIGEPVRVALPTAKADAGVVDARHVTLLSPSAWPGTLPPGRHGDVLGLMKRLEERGIDVVEFDPGTDLGYFNPSGLTALARIAGLSRPAVYNPGALQPPREVFMGRQTITAAEPPPCIELGDGSGVFVTLGSPFEGHRICPAGG
jgi:4-amino-4-deoxy-L-arabinose transferase-like glycosyltransferase